MDLTQGTEKALDPEINPQEGLIVDEYTANLALPLPHWKNRLHIDVQRLRTALIMFDNFVGEAELLLENRHLRTARYWTLDQEYSAGDELTLPAELAYSIGQIDIYWNGLRLIPDVNFVELPDKTAVQINFPLNVGDQMYVIVDGSILTESGGGGNTLLTRLHNLEETIKKAILIDSEEQIEYDETKE